MFLVRRESADLKGGLLDLGGDFKNALRAIVPVNKTTTAKPGPEPCKKGWRTWGDRCYAWITVALKGTEADEMTIRTACAKQLGVAKAHVVSIRSQEEMNFLSSYFNETSPNYKKRPQFLVGLVAPGNATIKAEDNSGFERTDGSPILVSDLKFWIDIKWPPSKAGQITVYAPTQKLTSFYRFCDKTMMSCYYPRI
ncbi:hypothetical protein QR680_012310 [Steinernema hermaphroditum]|uniref:C-type lectin domain-containing protein n=1 Tax=Steinernema hermaphroditum TaxID=289476 RepID=A0AA39I1N2_9BILA|nr:hypothetical protein QR680_012310 [Steinernema hermaphroditum]